VSQVETKIRSNGIQVPRGSFGVLPRGLADELRPDTPKIGLRPLPDHLAILHVDDVDGIPGDPFAVARGRTVGNTGGKQ
jgi:hypothetical protein